MYLIVGLGNPGEKYKNNRHNVGFQFIDYLIKKLNNQKSKVKNQNYNLKFKNEKRFSTFILHLTSNILLVKPLTFMNLSGQAVKQLVSLFKFHVSRDLIVVHDDLDIPLGKFKIQKGVGPKLHNGIESIEKALDTKDFWRVRIGVDNRINTDWIDGETYVLQNFKQKEKEVANQMFPKIYNQLKTLFLA